MGEWAVGGSIANAGGSCVGRLAPCTFMRETKSVCLSVCLYVCMSLCFVCLCACVPVCKLDGGGRQATAAGIDSDYCEYGGGRGLLRTGGEGKAGRDKDKGGRQQCGVSSELQSGIERNAFISLQLPSPRRAGGLPSRLLGMWSLRGA